MKAVFAVLGVILILGMFGVAMTGIDDARTSERTDAFAAVVTGGGITTADVELVADPYDDDILQVESITSDNVLDAPLPDAYVTATNLLTVRGLAAADTRTLTVVYNYGTQDRSVNTFLGMVPLLIGAAILMILVGAGWAAFSHR